MTEIQDYFQTQTRYARENAETEQRIYLLPAWREAPCYTDRERAALGRSLGERPS